MIAVDGSEAMIAKARERLGDRGDATLVSDLAELELDEPVDLIFSTATFHWIARPRRALPPPARGAATRAAASSPSAAAQGNVAEHAQAIAEVAAAARFAPYFEGMTAIWNFAGAEETEARLRAAGFAEARCWLQPKPVQPAEPARVHCAPSPSARTSTAAGGAARPVRRGGPRRESDEPLHPRLRPPQHRGRAAGSSAAPVECRAR